MSLTLELAPEVEAGLRAEADRTGMDPADFAARLIEEQITPLARERLTPEEWLRIADEWAAGNRWPRLPEAAYERESFYEDDRL